MSSAASFGPHLRGGTIVGLILQIHHVVKVQQIYQRVCSSKFPEASQSFDDRSPDEPVQITWNLYTGVAGAA